MHLRVTSFLVLGLTFTAILAQEGGITESETDFYDKKLRVTRALRQQLFKGEISTDPMNKSHAEAVDIAAKELTYPLAWQGRSARPGRTQPSQLIKETVDAVEAQLRYLNRNKEQSSVATLQRLFSRQLTVRAKEVILAGPPIASVNAARIIALIPNRVSGQGLKDWTDEALPRLRGDTADVVLETCADLMAADPKRVNDGTRLFLMRAAHDVLALPPQTPPLYKQATADKVVLAAMGVATRKVAFPKATPRGEVEGFKMLRAEALRVVAWASAPSIGAQRPAMVLASVAANDQGVNPPPRVEELTEAAIGLCRLIAKSGKAADFNPDYAAQQVARAVSLIGVEANKNIETKTASLRLRPWRVDGARLLEALDPLRKVKDPYIADMVRQARPVLIDMEAGRVGRGTDLGTWVGGDARPAGTALFKGGDPSTVTPRAGTIDG